MKKSLRIYFMLLVSISSVAYSSTSFAGCRTKCITRIGGQCVVKTKVCGISIDGAQRELERGWHSLERGWHRIYGSAIPGEIRHILNTYPMTIIGSAFGGLEGAALGAAIDRAVARSIARAEKTKGYVDTMPPWKDQIIWEGYAIATGRDISAVGSMKADREYLLDGIDDEYDQFLSCVGGSPSPNHARSVCLRDLDLAALMIVYKTN